VKSKVTVGEVGFESKLKQQTEFYRVLVLFFSR
jgi:hypothetical protein